MQGSEKRKTSSRASTESLAGTAGIAGHVALEADVGECPSAGASEANAGPTDFEGVMLWMKSALISLLHNMPASFELLVLVLNAGIDVYTDYSGMGMPELCLAMMTALMASSCPGCQPDVKLIRCGDIDSDCRGIMDHHQSTLESTCTFGDLRDRVPRQFRVSAEDMHSDFNQVYQQRLEQGECQQLLVVELGRALANKASNEVKDYVNAHRESLLGSTAYCYKHSRQCPVYKGLPEQRSNGRRSLAVAGITCKDWSVRGTRTGLLGPSFVPCICWFFQMMVLLPDYIAIECTANFDSDTLSSMLNPLYVFYSWVFSPVIFAIPSQRVRKYMIARRAPCKFHLSFDWEGFGSIFQQDNAVHWQCLLQSSVVFSQCYDAATCPKTPLATTCT